MNRILRDGAIAFIIATSLLWGWQQISFMHSASPQAKAACHGVGSSFWEMQNAYYRCLDRVEAGGRP
ncbi:hypothetical protein [Afipia sp. DC4300-2b1]|uniref:hypothetical protein n=1 Tax=Afipia sp. DC4300-2b1 TaxID=2804672 RepID=UPI003CEA2D86